MKLQDKDYVVVNINRKKHLAQVIKVADKITCNLVGKENASPDTATVIEADTNEILACLGTAENVMGESILGCKIEPFVDSETLNPWGTLYYFRKCSPSERKIIAKTLKIIGKKLQNWNLVANFPIDIEIRPHKGKMQGMFKPANKRDNCILTVKPVDFLELPDLVWHEIAHYLLTYYVPSEQKVKWIVLYRKGINLIKTTKEDLENLVKKVEELFAGECKTLKELRNELDDSEKKLWKALLEHIKRLHKLSDKDVETLLVNNYPIEDTLPPGGMQSSEVLENLFVTEYAQKDVNEFFCESFAYYMTGKELHETVAKRMRITCKTIGVKNANNRDSNDRDSTD